MGGRGNGFRGDSEARIGSNVDVQRPSLSQSRVIDD